MKLPIENTLDLMAAMVCEGLNFFRFAQHHTEEAGVADAFRVAANVRGWFLQDLHSAGLIADPACEQPWRLGDAALSYSSLHASFDGQHPERLAEHLYSREQELAVLVEREFHEQKDLKVRQILKGFYSAVQRDAEMWSRLSHRLAVAA